MIFIEEIVYFVAKDRFLGGGNTTCLMSKSACMRLHVTESMTMLQNACELDVTEMYCL